MQHSHCSRTQIIHCFQWENNGTIPSRAELQACFWIFTDLTCCWRQSRQWSPSEWMQPHLCVQLFLFLSESWNIIKWNQINRSLSHVHFQIWNHPQHCLKTGQSSCWTRFIPVQHDIKIVIFTSLYQILVYSIFTLADRGQNKFSLSSEAVTKKRVLEIGCF